MNIDANAAADAVCACRLPADFNMGVADLDHALRDLDELQVHPPEVEQLLIRLLCNLDQRAEHIANTLADLSGRQR
jgi:hypothetical protein